MEVKYLSYPLIESDFPEAICAIGSFDGVHLGHQKVISIARNQAKEQGVYTAVIIFEPHPLAIISPNFAPGRITPLSAKLELLENQGVDICYVFDFTSSLAGLAETDFVGQVLARMNFRGIVVGFDFSYGKSGTGSAASLKMQAAAESLFTVTVVEPYLMAGAKVSSSRIRDLLSQGEVSEASSLLGRPFAFTGLVIEGDKRGRKLGFPTMNLELTANNISLLKGVYAVRTLIDDDGPYYGVMNVGQRPTFYEKTAKTTYEIHLFDFKNEVYGKRVKVDVLAFIREEQAFSDAKSLVTAINNDIDQAKVIVSLHLKG